MGLVTGNRSRGFVQMLEVVLAIMILYMVLNQMQVIMASRYSDYSNVPRLYRFAKDLGLAMCGNDNFRQYFANGSLPPTGLTWWDPAWSQRVVLLLNGTYFVPSDRDLWTEGTSYLWKPCSGAGCPTVSDSTSYVTRGSKSLKITIGASDDGVFFNLNASNLLNYDYLEFDLFANGLIWVIMNDTAGRDAVYYPNHVTGSQTHLAIPLGKGAWTADSGFDWGHVQYMQLVGTMAIDYYVDGLFFRASTRYSEPIEFRLSAPETQLTNCANEVRVTMKSDNAEVASQSYNESNSDLPADRDSWTEGAVAIWTPVNAVTNSDTVHVARGTYSQYVQSTLANGYAELDMSGPINTYSYNSLEFDYYFGTGADIVLVDVTGKLAEKRAGIEFNYTANSQDHFSSLLGPGTGWNNVTPFDWASVMKLRVRGTVALQEHWIDGLYFAGNHSCNVVFLANLNKNTTTAYYIYYNNPNATAPDYSAGVSSNYTVGQYYQINNSLVGFAFNVSDNNNFGEIGWAGSPDFGTTNYAFIHSTTGGFASTVISTADGWALLGRKASGGGFLGMNTVVALKNVGPVFMEFERNGSLVTPTAPIFNGNIQEKYRLYRTVPMLYDTTWLTINAPSTIRGDANCGGRFHQSVTKPNSLTRHLNATTAFTTADGGTDSGFARNATWIAETTSAAVTTGYAQFGYNMTAAMTWAPGFQWLSNRSFTTLSASRDIGTLGVAAGLAGVADVNLIAGAYSWKNAFYVATSPGITHLLMNEYQGKLSMPVAVTAIRENLTQNLAWAVPQDIDYHVYLYNGSGGYQLRNLVDDSGNVPPQKTLAAFSCLNSGWRVLLPTTTSTYMPSRCRCNESSNGVPMNCSDTSFASGGGTQGPDWEDTNMLACTFRLSGDDIFDIQRSQTLPQLSVWFAVPYSDVENVTFLLKAGVGGGLPRNVYLYINNKSTGALELAATQAYSAARNEVHTFDLTKFLPDFYGKYNITVRADMGAPTVVFDLQYAYLNVTPFENVSYYKPTKITVRTWNRNG